MRECVDGRVLSLGCDAGRDGAGGDQVDHAEGTGGLGTHLGSKHPHGPDHQRAKDEHVHVGGKEPRCAQAHSEKRQHILQVKHQPDYFFKLTLPC